MVATLPTCSFNPSICCATNTQFFGYWRMILSKKFELKPIQMYGKFTKKAQTVAYSYANHLFTVAYQRRA